ncbi:CsgG/HfaB family protein [Actibacterium ureilyticum]|uniref:CsgG/HfaB family protein n=1 Tax=Actibacterium ureilyticum TaxID=1590614 RepID=UPI000BAB0560|nr:CsgG/HfaB family protein [Actibacterium ureilyticum]
MNFAKRALPAVLALGLAGGMAQAADGVDSSLDEIAQQIVTKTRADGVPIIGISTFTHSDGTCSELSNYITEFLVDSLFNAGEGQIELIERSQLSAIFRELELVYDGTIAPDAAKKLGEIEGVDALVSGSLIEFGERIKLQARLISTENGKLFSTARSDFPLIGSVSKMTATRSRGACGFTAAPGAAAEPAGQTVTVVTGDTTTTIAPAPVTERRVYNSDIFDAHIVSLFYSPNSGEISVAIRFNNKSDNEIALSYIPKTITASDATGTVMTGQGEVAGIRTCRGLGYMGQCNSTYPQYASVVPAGKPAQMNFTIAGVKGLEQLIMTLAFEMVVTPNTSEAGEYAARSIGYFDLVPTVRQ